MRVLVHTCVCVCVCVCVWSLRRKEPAYSAAAAGSIPGSARSPEEEVACTPVSLPGKSHGQRSLVGYSLLGLRVNTIEQLTSNNKNVCKWGKVPS